MGAKKYTAEVIREGKRIRWPKLDKFLPALIAVIIVCVIGALVLSLEDMAAGTIMKQLREWFAGIKDVPASK